MITLLKKILPQSFRDRYRPTWYEIRLQSNIIWNRFIRLFLRPPLPNVGNGSIYLHLGCGPINHPMFINIDARPAPHIHYVRRIDNLSVFKNNTVDLIYASHCLEHFSHRKIAEVLKEWYRVLKKGGVLRVSVPDFDLLLQIYRNNRNDINTIVLPLMGGQDYRYNFHYAVFTTSSLSSLLRETGFTDIKSWEPGSMHLTTFDDWSAGKITIHGRVYPVSLNIEAVK